ncbi:MAG: hypothetical protein IV100_24880 [Myxococcales bacterium]|nr:hypothetical protein [Myxococcales bacterium]
MRSALCRALASSLVVSTRRNPIVGLLGALLVAACAEPASDAVADATANAVDAAVDEPALIAADLCEHATEGPFKALTASVDAASAPEAYFSHTFLTVTGSGSPGRQYIKLSVSDAGEHVIGAAGVGGLTLTDATGTAITIDDETAVTACDGIETAYHVSLGIGTVTLSFDLTGAEAGLVILTGEHEDDEAQ